MIDEREIDIEPGPDPDLRAALIDAFGAQPADVDWAAADHPVEDSFYIWGPTVPDDFVVNHEQAARA